MKRHDSIRNILLLMITGIGILFVPNKNIQYLLCTILILPIVVDLSTKRHNIIRYILLIVISIIGIWFTPNRNIQHLLCAIVTQQFCIEISKIKVSDYEGFWFWKYGYLILCLVWEFYQFYYRGFLQVDQLTFDIIGIILSYIIFGLVMNVAKKDSLR